MSEFTMTLGNFEALPEKGGDNFATGIYEVGYYGMLIARCNQNGEHAEHVRAILEGLNGKKTGLDEITRLRAALERIDGLSKFSMHDAWQNCEDMRAIARDALAPTPAPSLGGRVICKRCQGNGEIITDRERYFHARPGDRGDEAVAECPDCGGEGIIDTPRAYGVKHKLGSPTFEAETDRLRRMVERRDAFIITNGLWDAFKEASHEEG